MIDDLITLYYYYTEELGCSHYTACDLMNMYIYDVYEGFEIYIAKAFIKGLKLERK